MCDKREEEKKERQEAREIFTDNTALVFLKLLQASFE